jgi:hypothetical protein
MNAQPTHPLLGQLARALVLAVAQQLDHAALVGGQAGDLPDDLAHEGGAFAEVALGAADAWLACEGGHFLHMVKGTSVRKEGRKGRRREGRVCVSRKTDMAFVETADEAGALFGRRGGGACVGGHGDALERRRRWLIEVEVVNENRALGGEVWAAVQIEVLAFTFVAERGVRACRAKTLSSVRSTLPAFTSRACTLLFATAT